MKRAHRDLVVWQEAMRLVEVVYALTASLAAEERYGLTSQMRRAAISVPSNIAEGAARGSSRELHRFLHIAGGSLAELDTQLELVERLGLCEIQAAKKQIDLVHKLLSALIASIRDKL